MNKAIQGVVLINNASSIIQMFLILRTQFASSFKCKTITFLTWMETRWRWWFLNNHCQICNFFNPEGKSPKYFQMRKQILLFPHEFGYFDITREII